MGQDFDSAVAAALKGRSSVGRDSDDIGSEIAVTVPVRGASGVLGAVVVAVPAQPTTLASGGPGLPSVASPWCYSG